MPDSAESGRWAAPGEGLLAVPVQPGVVEADSTGTARVHIRIDLLGSDEDQLRRDRSEAPAFRQRR